MMRRTRGAATSMGGCVRFLGFGLCLLLLVGCSNAPAPGSVYTSGLGNFTVKVPRFVEPGMKMAQRSDRDLAAVSFSDDMGQLLRIESERTPAAMKPMLTPERI